MQSLTFLGCTLGMSSEYLSTRYDSADGHMAAVAKTTTKETNDADTDGITVRCCATAVALTHGRDQSASTPATKYRREDRLSADDCGRRRRDARFL